MLVRVAAAGSFYNQRLRAWHPILTPTWVIVAFLAVAAAFIPIGIVLKAASDDVSLRAGRWGRCSCVSVCVAVRAEAAAFLGTNPTILAACGSSPLETRFASVHIVAGQANCVQIQHHGEHERLRTDCLRESIRESIGRQHVHVDHDGELDIRLMSATVGRCHCAVGAWRGGVFAGLPRIGRAMPLWCAPGPQMPRKTLCKVIRWLCDRGNRRLTRR